MKTVLIGVLWGGLTLYAVLGGADFGAGVLHLRASERRRAAITKAMGPLWEANHVWLIFFLTGLLTLFPGAFSALGSALFAPATLVLFGLSIRGAALLAPGPLRLAFGLASAFTPFVYGAIAAGLALDRSWIGVVQFEVGLLAVAACTALAACFLGFQRAALAATSLTAVLALGGIALAPHLFGPAMLAGLVALGVTLFALRVRRLRLARVTCALFMTSLVWGWGLAQYPRLIGAHTVANSAAAPAELHAVAIALAFGLVALIPACWLLYRMFRVRVEVAR